MSQNPPSPKYPKYPTNVIEGPPAPRPVLSVEAAAAKVAAAETALAKYIADGRPESHVKNRRYGLERAKADYEVAVRATVLTEALPPPPPIQAKEPASPAGGGGGEELHVRLSAQNTRMQAELAAWKAEGERLDMLRHRLEKEGEALASEMLRLESKMSECKSDAALIKLLEKLVANRRAYLANRSACLEAVSRQTLVLREREKVGLAMPQVLNDLTVALEAAIAREREEKVRLQKAIEENPAKARRFLAALGHISNDEAESGIII